ncbi:MAG TPA: chromosome segregation protein SMC [Acidimicrobiales bacterium]
MFLKRLTMKGFKSFADNTVLEFEPGVTAVVGPNGSGKSNVVDAVTWVLGAQSTRALRSARMDDVIFMGTANRAALGRAEVSLTLDNSSKRLPIDGAEVTISRTLFRNGDSEYAINGTTCRLLDVQELLGDSGVGRQQHMIIGQGQLDAILNSNPENRRAVIEEAAGVLKHRRRKERAERRLAATQENLERLGDLVREVRRQMRPLERQAASARSFADVEHELRATRHALFATRLAAFEARRSQLETELATASERERALRHDVLTLDAQASAAAAEMSSRREELLASSLGKLQGLAERTRGTASLIAERERALRQALVASADENVIATLEADAAHLVEDLVALEGDERALVPRRDELDSARRALDVAEADFEERFAGDPSLDEAQLVAARERLVLLERSLTTLRENAERARARLSQNQARAQAGEDEARANADEVIRVSAERDEATRALDAARASLELAEATREQSRVAHAEATDVAARAQARAEALARALDELSGAGGRALLGGLDGVLGSFLELIEVEPGWEKAVESAAGASAAATVVNGRHSVRAALATLRREGGAGLILPVAEGAVVVPPAPDGTRALRDVVRPRPGAPAHVATVLDALFARCFVVADWESGIDLAEAHRDLVLVTIEGDRFAASGWRVASGRSLVTRATVDEALALANDAVAALAPREAAWREAESALEEARGSLQRATATLAQLSARVERLAADATRLARENEGFVERVRTATQEVDELETALAQRAAEVDARRDELPSLEEALANATRQRLARDEARRVLDAQREHVSALATALSRTEAELGERRRLIEQRQREIESRLEGRTGERREAAERRVALEFDLSVLARLATLVEQANDDVRVAQEALDSTYREQLEATRASGQRLEEARRARREAEARLNALAEATRASEIERAELAVKLTNLGDAIRRDLGVEPDELGDAPEVVLAEGVTLAMRVGELEARVSSLGPINPLALEELAALEERYRDLDAQVSDVRHARRELQEVLRTLDEEIMTTFMSAYADVNEHFSALISMLFPGGQGRLNLSEPDDPLNTGVEIEVRPMGRNVRRISLLSGGERSMAALAFLFAVFRSRPSPFYLMDEVEAALDDVNLQRFLSLVDEFRDEAQLLIVTHQKRTMEAADALYGVTMVPGASSKVVSQRVNRPREVEPA